MNSSEDWIVLVEPKAGKTAKKFPKKDRERIKTAVAEMRFNPYSGDCTKLEGGDVWRRRVGPYRIFFELGQSDRVVVIFRIERRGSGTY